MRLYDVHHIDLGEIERKLMNEVSTLLTQGSGSHGQGQEAEASHLRRRRPRRGTKLTIVLTCTLLTDANTSVTHSYVLVIFYLIACLL